MNKSDIRKKNVQKGKYNRGYKSKIEEQDQNQENAERKILPSNWSKYEIFEKNEHESSESKNFNLLSSEPTFVLHSFFKFKSEHSWDKDVSFVELSNYFLLDLKLLSEGTICVPFSQRQDLNLFPFADIDDNNKKVQNYTTYLEKRLFQKIPTKFITDGPAIVNNIFDDEKCPDLTHIKEDLVQNIDLPEEIEELKITQINILNEVGDNSESFKDDVNELLSLKIPEHPSNTFDSNIKAEDPLTLSAANKTTTATTALNLEQWLDDILDA